MGSDEIEHAFDDILSNEERRDGSFKMGARVPSGRQIWVIWRYDLNPDEIVNVFGDVSEPEIFVITAY